MTTASNIPDDASAEDGAWPPSVPRSGRVIVQISTREAPRAVCSLTDATALIDEMAAGARAEAQARAWVRSHSGHLCSVVAAHGARTSNILFKLEGRRIARRDLTFLLAASAERGAA